MNSAANTVVIKQGNVLLPNGETETCDVLIQDGVILKVGSGLRADRIIKVEGCHVLPGLIDIHTHGINRVSVLADEGLLEEYARIEASRGTTTFYPTLFGPPEKSVNNLKRHLKDTDNLRTTPQVAGFRLESPYLARTGAGLQEHLVPISSEVTGMLLDAGEGHIKIWDISPELSGASECIRELTDDGIVCSIAHTLATVEQGRIAVDAGARLVTHLFDTFEVPEMKDPGVYPAGLADYLLVEDRVVCEIIADGTHVHPLLVEKTFRCKTPERLVFVTDSNYGAGLPSGRYDLPGNWGRVIIDGSNNGVRLIDRDMTLSGSALTPIDCFRNAIKLFHKDIATASRVCSKTQAELLGLNKGEISAGKDGDIIILDSEFDVEYTIVNGEVLYQKDR